MLAVNLDQIGVVVKFIHNMNKEKHIAQDLNILGSFQYYLSGATFVIARVTSDLFTTRVTGHNTGHK